MKINQLRFKNLNSLAGEWSIDFTASEYVADGIFAISGPTGAGKSTILDAICLALYGRTPRLKNISKSTNEIMSRQTGVCFSEVVFGTREGHFIAFWSQRRAREKADGALQNPDHEISDADTRKVISSQLSTTSREIERLTGMDYDRFVQSMMLAQGGFAAFLQARGDERAPILEQITGTKIYSDISIYVHQRNNTEKANLEQLKAESRGIILLSPEEEAETTGSLLEKNTGKIALSGKVGKLDASIKWIRAIQDLRNDLAAISGIEAALTKDLVDFEPERKVLVNARKAASLDGEFASLKGVRDQQKNDLELLTALQVRIPVLEAGKTDALSAFNAAERAVADAKAEQNLLLKITTQARLLDQQIGQKKSDLEKAGSQIRVLKGELEEEVKKKKDIKRSIDELNSESSLIESYQADNRADASLVNELTGIRAIVTRLLDYSASLSEAEERQKLSKQALQDKTEEISGIDRELAVVTNANKADLESLELAKATLTALLNGKSPDELQRRKDDLILHLADLRKIADYETERALLADGKPCPLCGSLHHPYAEGNVPSVNEAEQELAGLIALLKEYGSKSRQIVEIAEAEKISGAKVISENSRRNIAQQQKLTLGNDIQRQGGELNRLKAGYDQISSDLKNLLLPFGITGIPEDELKTGEMLMSLEIRKERWQNQGKRITEIGTDISKKQAEAGRCDAIIETKEKDISVREREAGELGTALKDLSLSRKELFGEKRVDEEEKRAGIRVSEAEAARNKTDELLQQKNQSLATDRVRINDLKIKSGERKTVLDESERQFSELLLKIGFADEADFLSCRLAPAEKERLEAVAGALDTRKTQLETRKKEKQESLAREELKKLTEDSPEKLSADYEESKKALEILLQEIGALTQKLEANTQARILGEEITRKVGAQKGVCERWARLNELIGSHDGKKYRNFAQGLTLEVMVSYANSQLVKLSDRYLLIRDRGEPLELNVIDNYQAGEIRSTRNLSGGESFIVSLALALGLSRMSGRNVSVDSLFLDEGFGTLDEETLETALGTLAGLRQDGKMIGVISHVGAMKERINTKIIVQPIREGRSVLSGPGCKSAG
jgi:DNA repair protein SbcC/Rad50